ncbi:pyridoxamine 5'-phosphate oxidase family protein [Demequina sp. SYSU T00039]|uniref:Pyridoxamine 5'-phosphate oxidase family protein n=1 Tax=Demequina lignilytica TaxID=3051663 RepID=A0AAW7M5E6_9MICO|nr:MULTISPECIES: pyridoxamine 5'-phosphate oxidase family protein [unclassified Demequina]MDN4477532.1 pyridoxamine 5'-phosphate oxidase family protein [Demequina sp. SYSU T00039-1]MDN4488117.1 pyridoxamine 5'-phosphate oxidase family protein [Demequina sp. SYSU T00039]MDN4490558.1 pyridoxamine 5'-phosphate oxidase family protein [Demequina sp. SYSU T00068]
MDDRPRRAAVRALLVEAAVWTMATRAEGGALRSRPVTLFADAPEGGADALVLTAASSRKAVDLERWPEVALAGPVPGGWLAAGGTARVIRDPEQVARHVSRLAPGVPAEGVCVLAVTLDEARRWTVLSSDPFDNQVEPLLP